MQLYFIRHGQSQNNLLWDQTGSSQGRSHDPELTPTGRRQADALADFLASCPLDAPVAGRDPKNLSGFGLTHLYCSLMLRAVQTGQPVARRLGLPLRGWLDVHEEGGIYMEDTETGDLRGMPGGSRSFFSTGYPELDLPELVSEQGWWNRPFEEMALREERARRVLAELRSRHGGTQDRVAVISHGGFFNILLRALLRLDPTLDLWYSMNNTGVSRIDFEGDRFVIVYTNRTDFLSPDLIT